MLTRAACSQAFISAFNRYFFLVSRRIFDNFAANCIHSILAKTRPMMPIVHIKSVICSLRTTFPLFMKRAILFVALVCMLVSGLTSYRQHRAQKIISVVSSKHSQDDRERASMSHPQEKGKYASVLSLRNIATGAPVRNLNLEHTGFFVSYNATCGIPSWVAWELTASETTGPISRKNYDFMPDPLVPKENQVLKSDYKNSGYDRGHMCPAGDMEWSADAMHDCHYMTNICPQAPKLNQNYWERLESACRRWADREGAIYIVCGPICTSSATTIGPTGSIRVPDAYFKVVLSLNEGNEKGIGFVYLNSDDRQTMEGAATTIDKVEEITGYDFFSELPDTRENQVEGQCDLRAWN